jgi:peptidoglycan/LPS O-acetylase OafA/YrhL
MNIIEKQKTLLKVLRDFDVWHDMKALLFSKPSKVLFCIYLIAIGMFTLFSMSTRLLNPSFTVTAITLLLFCFLIACLFYTIDQRFQEVFPNREKGYGIREVSFWQRGELRYQAAFFESLKCKNMWSEDALKDFREIVDIKLQSFSTGNAFDSKFYLFLLSVLSIQFFNVIEKISNGNQMYIIVSILALPLTFFVGLVIYEFAKSGERFWKRILALIELALVELKSVKEDK